MNVTLYNDKYCIGLEELNKIYIALLTTSDLIYLNANVEIDKSVSVKEHEHINNCLVQLEQKGMLKYWCFPNDKFNRSRNIKYESLVELDKEEYNKYCYLINGYYFSNDKLASIFNIIKENDIDKYWVEETTSKILLCRKEYWSYAIMKMLNASGLLNCPTNTLPSRIPFKSMNGELKLSNQLISKIFYKTNLSFSSLTGNEISEFCKKRTTRFIKNEISVNDVYFDMNLVLDQAIEAARYKRNKMIRSVISDFMILLLQQPLSTIFSVMKSGVDLLNNDFMNIGQISFLLYQTKNRAERFLRHRHKSE